MEGESSSIIKTEEKKNQLRWKTSMDTILLDTLVDATREGKRNGPKWNNDVLSNLRVDLSKKANVEVKNNHIENRLRQMKNEFRSFLELKKKSGVNYDAIKQMLLISDDYWEELLSIPKNKKFKVFQDRGLKWDFDKLFTIIGDSSATGSYSLNGLDVEKIDTDDGKEEMNENTADDVEGSVSSPCTKNMPSSSSKREHGKKIKAIDEVKGILEGVNSRLEKLTETIDPLTFGKQLREKLMEVEGFSQKFKNETFKILMKDRIEAEIFLLTDEDGRKDIFADMRQRIGDV